MDNQGMMGMGGQQQPMPQYQVQAPPLAPPEPEEEDDPVERETFRATQNVNLAEKMDDDLLTKIAQECKRGFDDDEQSRADWMRDNDEWMKLAQQVYEKKSFPWQNASNIKYPLLSTAALQFNARSYPTLVPADGKLVKTRLWGKDPSGEKAKKAERIATYMSWQFSEELPYWEEEMDKLLIATPIIGMMFKKTFYNSLTEKNDSVILFPENFVIDYWAKSIETCERYSEIIPMTPNRVKEKQLAEIYLDIDLGRPTGVDNNKMKRSSQSTVDFMTPHKIIEQHTWLDLDEDNLREPYIVTFDYTSAKILRISPRFTPEGIFLNSKGKPKRFKAECYYTKFPFIPNPDGSFYDLGFGALLGPLNEAANTTLNILVDSGHLATLNAGFIGKGLRLKMGDQPLKPGEFRSVNAVGDDLRKQIFPMPFKEPSAVLFQLLGMMIQAGKELASVAEIMVGKMPGQNTPATTTMATIEQGMKVFTAIYKRIYRALGKEYKKMFCLNGYYLDEATYGKVLDEPVGPKDFDEDVYDVCPTADPTATTQAEKLLKAQALMDLMGTGLIDPTKAVIRMLQAQEQPQWEELIPGMAETGQPSPPQEKPDPKLQAIQAKAQIDQQKAATDQQLAERRMQMEESSEAAKLEMKKEEQQVKLQAQIQKAKLEAGSKMQMSEIFAADAKTKAIQSALQGQQKLSQKDAEHRQKLSQEKQKSTQKNSKAGGKG